MSRFVEVKATKWTTYVVELEDDADDDEAFEVLMDYDEAEVKRLTLFEIEPAQRHADEVHYLEYDE